MPGVTVLPGSPGLAGFGTPQLGKTIPSFLQDKQQTIPASAMQSRTNSQNNELDAGAIKEQAKNLVHKQIPHGSSGGTILALAQKKYAAGKENENKGDVKESLASYVMAASLVKMAMESPENKKGTTLRNEVDTFLKSYGDLGERLKTAEDKVKIFGQAPQSPQATTGGISIADRKKALEGNGLSLGNGPVKRLSRSAAEMTPPSSPKHPSIRISTPTMMAVPLLPSVPAVSPSSPQSSVSSSFAPASPPVSPTATFTQSFPTIEEIEAPFHVPSAPLKDDIKSVESRNGTAGPIQIERSSSAPTSPTAHSFLSRSVSPTKPLLPRKPSNLSIMSSSTVTQQPSTKPVIPVSGTTTPDDLTKYLIHHNILLLDVRSRSDFESGNLKSPAAIACVDPSILRDENLTLVELENAMSSAPPEERSVFSNRDKFDIVVLYDNHSKSLGTSNTPLSILDRLISNARPPQKVLKRQPMLLIGGLNAWRRGTSSSDVPSTASLEVAPSLDSQPMSRVASTNPFLSNRFSAAPLSPQPFVPNIGTPFHRSNMSLDQGFGHSRFPAEAAYTPTIPPLHGGFARRPAIARHDSTSSFTTGSSDNLTSPSTSYYSSLSPGQFSYPALAQIPSTSPGSSLASLPQASIKPSQLSRKRTDYDDPSQNAISDIRLRSQIAYPNLFNPPILQPPPPAASSALERQDTRPRLPSVPTQIAPAIRMQSPVFQVHYWSDFSLPLVPLRNLGNTCFINATLQCLYATDPFMNFFRNKRWEESINMVNRLGTQGQMTKSFESLMKEMWGTKSNVLRRQEAFMVIIRRHNAQYEGFNQHDSQEFLSFLLDKIHEDLNRVLRILAADPPPTPEQELALEMRDPRQAIDEEWAKWRNSNDSIIVDLFQGQFKSRLQCSICSRTSTTYNTFSILQLSIPRQGTTQLQDCLNALTSPEELRGDDRWHCPTCKTKRNATKFFSLARLPPILVIHLKRFETNGNSAGKIDTFVNCPTKYLEFPASRDMPDDPHGGPSGDPRTQIAPYRYELYGVTNHHGVLSKGHYTAHIQARGEWHSISDDAIQKLTSPVVTKEAYVLFYKRVKIDY